MPKKNFLLPVLRLAIEGVIRGKEEVFGAKNTRRNPRFQIYQFFILVSDLDSGSVSVSDLLADLVRSDAGRDSLHPFSGVEPNCLEGLLVSRSRVEDFMGR